MMVTKKKTTPKKAVSKRSTTNTNGKPKDKFAWLTNEQRSIFRDMVGNVSLGRQQFISQFLDSRRSIDDDAGYPRHEELGIKQYHEMYAREALSARVVEVLPRESWKVQPSVFETEDPESETEFERRWKEVNKNLGGEGWFEDENSGSVWGALLRADILSGIGSFGVVLLGFDDLKEGDSLQSPVKDASELLFLREFDESLVSVASLVADRTDRRFGRPESYNITLGEHNEAQHFSGAGVSQSSTGESKVHWTRVIHIADNLRSSEVFGVPRMKTVYNRLMDLRKLYAGSAEMYWRGAFPGLSFETHPQLGGDIDLSTADKDALRDVAEQYMNTLQRYIQTTGMTVKSLAPQVVDPTPQIDTQIEALCIYMAIPKRIFTGSERGELASSQDMITWNGRIQERQNNYISPRIIAPLVDRLITVGVLPEPKEGYRIKWPDMTSITAIDQAEVALKNTEAMAKYVGGNVEALIEPVDFLVRIIGMTEDEATEVVDAAMSRIEDEIIEGMIVDPAKDVEVEQALKEANLKSAQRPPETPDQK